MAWTVKPSATTQIERRDEPYLTPRMKDRYTGELLPRYETKMGALLPILIEMQELHRCIPYQAMVEIAQFLEISAADVLDTVSFYEGLTTEPTGRFVIAVCQSVACEVCGHQVMLDHLRRKLEIEPHETTDDGMVTLLALECLGSCDTAPVALVNDRLHENLTMEKIDEILDALPDEEPPPVHQTATGAPGRGENAHRTERRVGSKRPSATEAARPEKTRKKRKKKPAASRHKKKRS
ncbi:MAG: NADH-quinone oxidoreductase subunit NuoE family protein [Planctomycetota bacterium]|jgi:NADH:ubiquinone oxidoreductase subunit E